MILGIDYGLKNIGLAISEGEIAEPYQVVHNIAAIKKIVKELNVTHLIVGVSEGTSGELATNFGKNLAAVLHLPLDFIDETLSSYEAGPKAHAKAAAVILQRYLDTKNHV